MYAVQQAAVEPPEISGNYGLGELYSGIEQIWMERLQRGRERTRLAVRSKTADVYACYRALWQQGFQVRPAGLKARHVQVLEMDMKRSLSRSTAKRRWSVLRTWSGLIGKSGLVGPFDKVWPPASGESPKGRPYRRLLGLSPSQFEVLEADLAARPAWLHALRLMRHVGLTKAEALGTDLVTGASRTVGYLLLEGKNNQCGRAIELGPPDGLVAQVVGQAHEFLNLVGRRTLADVESPMKLNRTGWRKVEIAVERFDNAIAYRLNKRGIQ